MNQPTQHDYRGEPQLVPGGLRVYRHYKLSGVYLRPTTQSYTRVVPGLSHAVCLAPEYLRADRRCAMCFGRGLVYRQVLSPYPDVEGTKWFPREEGSTCSCVIEHPAPLMGCTCGFYASYDPDTDFFQSYARQPFGLSIAVEAPPIFAVVEASGKVLMGSRGVRAEKMEVKAIALDFSHIYGWGGYANGGDLPRSSSSLFNTVMTVADNYNVPWFENMTAMVEAFPPPDLSGLIKNKE